MIVANGKAAQFLGPARTADYRPSLVSPLPLWSGRDVGWYSWYDVEWMRRDPQCQFGLRILRGPLATVTWEIPASSPEVAAWVDRTLRKVWTHYLNKVTAHLEYGSCGGELTWRYDRTSDLIELDELLDIHILDMQPLQQRRKQVGVRVKSSYGGMETTDLFHPRYWWIANEPEFGAYHGRARLAGAWIPWQEKTARHGARDVRRLWYVKNVMDGGTLYVPPGTTEVEPGVNKANQDYGREIMEKSMAGGVKVFPNVTDEKGKRLWEYEPPKINGELTGIHTLMEEEDVEILVGMGIPPEVVQAADTGSGWSGRSVPFLVFLTSEDQLADTTIQAIDRHALRPGVAVNFGEDARYEIRLKSLVKQAEEEEAKKKGQAPGAKPGEAAVQGQEQKPGSPQGQGRQQRPPAAPVRMSVQHAPAGGITIGGQDFKGGEFILGDVLAKATKEEKAKLRREGRKSARSTESKDGPRAEIKKLLRSARSRQEAAINQAEWAHRWYREVLPLLDPEKHREVIGAVKELLVKARTEQYPGILEEARRVRSLAHTLGVGLDVHFNLSAAVGALIAATTEAAKGERQFIAAHKRKAKLRRSEGPPRRIPISGQEKPPERLSIQHAPPGGVTIGGQAFKGGEFIPGEVLAKATKEERTALKEGKKAERRAAVQAKKKEKAAAVRRAIHEEINSIHGRAEVVEERPADREYHDPFRLEVEKQVMEALSSGGKRDIGIAYRTRLRETQFENERGGSVANVALRSDGSVMVSAGTRQVILQPDHAPRRLAQDIHRALGVSIPEHLAPTEAEKAQRQAEKEEKKAGKQARLEREERQQQQRQEKYEARAKRIRERADPTQVKATIATVRELGLGEVPAQDRRVGVKPGYVESGPLLNRLLAAGIKNPDRLLDDLVYLGELDRAETGGPQGPRTWYYVSEPERLSIQHAPPGGVSIGGQDFRGGEFIPGDVLAKATTEEKIALKEGKKAEKKTARREQAKAKTEKRRERSFALDARRASKTVQAFRSRIEAYPPLKAAVGVLGQVYEAVAPLRKAADVKAVLNPAKIGRSARETVKVEVDRRMLGFADAMADQFGRKLGKVVVGALRDDLKSFTANITYPIADAVQEASAHTKEKGEGRRKLVLAALVDGLEYIALDSFYLEKFEDAFEREHFVRDFADLLNEHNWPPGVPPEQDEEMEKRQLEAGGQIYQMLRKALLSAEAIGK